MRHYSLQRFLTQKNIYFFCLGIYVFLAIASIFSGITGWDEESDYLGIRTQIAHAVKLVVGQPTDYRDIHADLEYYGIIGLLPAWLLWFIQQSLLTSRVSLPQALFYPEVDHQLNGFFAYAHLILACEFILLSVVVFKIAKEIPLRYPWIAAALIFITPSLVGNSFVNSKDIPFALFYTLYTLTLIERRRYNPAKNIYWLSVFAAAFLVNLKLVTIIVVIISEALLSLSSKYKVKSCRESSIFLMLVLAIALVFQPAAWSINPFPYIIESISKFSNHGWGGCMWWAGECVGVNSSSWNTSHYIVKWTTIKVPYLLLFLASVSICSSLWKIFNRQFQFSWSWFFVILQLALIPIMAAIRQSNLYDADRHILFIYPALAVIAASGIQTINESKFLKGYASTSMQCFICLLGVILFLDNLMINPYQSSYLNESARYFHSNLTTSIDYWAVSSKELIRNAQLKREITVHPQLKTGLWISPFWIAFRQLGGQVSDSSQLSPLYQVRDPSNFSAPPVERDCSFGSSVKRNLIPNRTITLSKLYFCRN